MRLWVAALTTGLCGAVGPLTFLVADLLINDPASRRHYRELWDVLDSVGYMVWPTQLLMGMTHGKENTLYGYSVFTVALAANVLLFAGAGAVCWGIIKGVLRVVRW